MRVDAPRRSVHPRCHNRAPYRAERVVAGIGRDTGEPVRVVIREDWSTPGCVTWAGTGIGQPAPGHPAGTPYPLAHGFDCRGCRHLPREFEGMA